MSLRRFSALWPLARFGALDLECVYSANVRIYIEPEVTGRRVIIHRYACGVVMTFIFSPHWK